MNENIISDPPACYSILGATGNCGTALLTICLQMPDVQVKVYCRNREKLFRLVPESKDNDRVEIFNGSILDADLLGKAMAGCKAVFLTASTNDNIPGCHISQDLARTVIKALEKMKGKATIPKLILLSSATIDPWLSRKHPWVNMIVRRSAWHVYKDLELAEKFLREQEEWAPCVYIKPGGLSVDVQRGHRLTLDAEESFVSYLDVAAGMLEAANEPEGKWSKKNVGIINANGKAKFPAGTPMCIVLGLLRFYFPFLHPHLPLNAGPA
ncbi:StcQ-like protein [Beauveria bassiana ARSEF 2860]|uniref:StcQ-like protein n=1 Tax=Beauveria bassiana (strain ARSEF 2860) TaxID=655819 RepID=J4UQZ3_BEAB2|nr:StcQ-like protein [Beauveria bassiana ARSEF 2860]EJP67852.1 StcQ-like protein [Beauveria bassiana ARSEF 2860]